MALKIGRRSPLDCKAYKGVLDLEDPYAVPSNYLARTRNLYLPQPGSNRGAYARPGFQLTNADDPMADLSSGRIGQGMAIATTENGTQINFCVCGGRLFRIDPSLQTREDVTPVGVTIDPMTRVHLTPFSNRLAVNDDVNTPWIASNLQASPVAANVIPYSSAGVPWRAFGRAIVYDDALVWLVRVRDNDARTVRIAWSEPDDPFTGYFQADFDNEWDVVENDTDAIYALFGTNSALDYFRDESIGYIAGTIGSDFRTTAITDAVKEGVGSRTPATVCQFGQWIYFADREGRVNRVTQAGGHDELWAQHGRAVAEAPTAWTEDIDRVACAAIIPELSLYIAALWSPNPGQLSTQFPTTLYAFHARTGTYAGEWTIGAGIAVHAIGTLVGVTGKTVLAILGTAVSPAGNEQLGQGGYLWTLSSLGDGIWTDNGELPDIFATTPPLGEDADIMLNVDQVVAIVQELQSAQPAIVAMVVQKDGNGDWIIVPAGAPAGAIVDVGEGDAIFDLTQEYFVVSDGNDGYTISPDGPAIAVVADAGDGTFELSTDMTRQAARLYPGPSGDVWAIRLDMPIGRPVKTNNIITIH